MSVRLTTVSCAIALLLSLASAAEPPALTPQQQEKLKERDRLLKEGLALRDTGKFAEAIKVMEQSLAIDREVLGNVHPNVAYTLLEVAALHREREDFAASHKAFEELRTVRTKLHGEKD